MDADRLLFAAFMTSPSGEIISWNVCSEALFGLDAGAALYRPLSSLLGEPDLLARIELDHCQAMPLQWRAADGRLFDADLTLIPQVDAKGAPSGRIACLSTHVDNADSAMVGRMPLSKVIDVLPGTFYVIRPDGSFALWNKMLERVTGMSADQVRQTSALDMYDGAERRVIGAKIAEVFEHDMPVFVEATYLNSSGQGTPYMLCGARIECDGKFYLCGMGLDISQRRAQEDTLRLRDRALHATSNGLVITGCAGRDNPIEYVNPAFERITGYSAEEALGRDSRFMAAPGLDEDERTQLRRAIRERREVSVLFRNRRKSGEIFWNHLTITPVSNDKGKVTHFIGVINDVTAIQQRTADLEHEVNHDALTGLANRTLLWDRIEQAIHMAQRNKSMVAIVLVDLDGFKRINDTYGHEAGDAVLIAVAKRLQSAVRESDTVARLSGDEFVLVLVNQPSLRYTMRMIERLRAAMSKPVQFDNTEMMVGASMGVSVFPHDGNGALDLVRTADVAMYHAKSNGKSAVHFFSPDMKSTTEAKQQIEDDLRNALERNEMFLLYQPKFCLRDGHIHGIEALLRWSHPSHGILAPAAFLPEAEENGLIVPLGQHVLEQVCGLMGRLAKAGIAPLPVAINVSHREFSQQHYVQHVAEVLARHALAPQRLEIELREEGLNANQHLGVEVVTQLRDLGVQRSIDAFGDRMSDLNYLQKLPLTHVKLAKVAVHQITADARSGVVARALIDVGHDLGSAVIAKGVETQVQMEFLRSNNCDEIQGNFISPPLDERALCALLLAQPA